MTDYKASRKRHIIFNGGLSHLGELEKYKKLRFIFLKCLKTYFVNEIDLGSHLKRHYKIFAQKSAGPYYKPSHVLRGDLIEPFVHSL